MKTINKKSKIDLFQYINIRTGELLSEEHPTIKVIEPTDFIIIDSTEYIIIDSKSMRYISTYFSPTDVGRIIEMANMIKGSFNILHNRDGNPHNKNTLMKEIEYTRNKFSDFMKRLHERSIIHYFKEKNSGDTFILLNPFLARKRKSINKNCALIFEDISKIENK